MPTSPTQNRPLDRRIYWTAVAAWAVASWLIGNAAAEHMRWRINDLAAIPGAGMIVRNPDGVFYHISPDDKATAVLRPTRSKSDDDEPADSVTSLQNCGNCTLVTGDQLSQTNAFCSSGVKTSLPAVTFEAPCQSWATIDEGPKVMATVIFLLPILVLPLIRMIYEASIERRRKAAVRS